MAVLAAAAASLACSADAFAVTTLGSPLVRNQGGGLGSCGNSTCTFWHTQLTGATLVAPSNGVIVRWRVKAASTDSYRLRILEPDGSGNATIIASSAPLPALGGNAVTTAEVRMPIEAHGFLAIETPGGAPYPIAMAGGTQGGSAGDAPDGASFPVDQSPHGGIELLFNADFEPDPDADGFGDESQDNCPAVANAGQENADTDSDGNACDGDDDNDGRDDGDDNCELDANRSQRDFDRDGRGDACDPPQPGPCANVVAATGGADTLVGSPFGDRIEGRRGDDRLFGLGGRDCVTGGAGDDTLAGDGGRDVLSGGAGRNSYSAGPGRDRVKAANGVREVVDCGAGRDRATVDRRDRVRRCESVKRR
jgi:hypothetical protein